MSEPGMTPGMTIVYTLADGSTRTVDAGPGRSVMQAAVEAGVPGIVAECGGSAMCATCHVYVDPAEAGLFAAIGDAEDEMLDCTASARTGESRLSCQLVARDDVRVDTDVHVRVPDRQR